MPLTVAMLYWMRLAMAVNQIKNLNLQTSSLTELNCCVGVRLCFVIVPFACYLPPKLVHSVLHVIYAERHADRFTFGCLNSKPCYTCSSIIHLLGPLLVHNMHIILEMNGSTASNRQYKIKITAFTVLLSLWAYLEMLWHKCVKL